MRFILPFILLCCLTISSTAQWVTKNPSLATQRHHGIGFTVGGNAYLVSGTTAQSNPLGTDNFYRYNKDADSWTELTRFPGGARAYAYADVYNDKAYFGFGSNDNITFFNDLWEFDPQTEEWTQLSSCPCAGRTHPAFVVHNGKIYVGLGGSAIGDRNDWWEYDIDSDNWTQRPALPGPPRHHPFHFSAGDYVYAGFGHQGNNYYADWYRYDTESNTWTQMNNHPGGPRVAGQEFSHNGIGYVISGDGNNHLNLQEGEFWKYEHEDDTWTRLPNHPGGNITDPRKGRWAPGSFVLDNHVYFFGGVNRGQGILFGDMFSYELEETSSNNELEISSVSVFPNPATDIIYIDEEISSYSEITFKIFDSKGNLIKAKKTSNNYIQIGDLSAGMYVINFITNNNDQYTSKFMVVK